MPPITTIAVRRGRVLTSAGTGQSSTWTVGVSLASWSRAASYCCTRNR